MAEYSNLDLDSCSEILRRYGAKPTSVNRMEAGAANSSFHVKAEGGDEFVVTLVDNFESVDVSELVQLVSKLALHGIPVDGVVPTLEGELISYCDSTPVVVKPYVQGNWPNAADLTVVRRVGRLLGSIHQVPAPFTLRRGGRLIPSNWIELAGPRIPSALSKILSRSETISLSPEWAALERTLCHGDLFPDNLLEQENGELVALDWETASVDPAVLDLGISIAAFWEAVEQFGFEQVSTVLMAGYREIRELGTSDIRQLANSTFYGLSMLAFHRFYRHNIRFPNTAKKYIYQELVDRANRIPGVSGN